jgi:hypothetical protein
VASSILVPTPPKETPFLVNGRISEPWLAFLNTLPLLGAIVQQVFIDLAGGTPASTAALGEAINSVREELGSVIASANSGAPYLRERVDALEVRALSDAWDPAGAAAALLLAANTWLNAQTFTAAPVFTDAAGTRSNLAAAGLNVSNTFTLSQVISAALAISLTITGNLNTGFGGLALLADGTPVLNARTYGSAAATALAGITLVNWSVIYHNSGSGLLIETANASPLVFGTNNAECGRFVSGGRLLIGTTTDDLSNLLQVNGGVSLGALKLNGALNLNGQTITGSTSGPMTIGRSATFASAAVFWGLNVTKSDAGDNLVLGQSSATYSAGAIAWIGNSNAFLYFNSGQDFRIGAGVGATPIITVKGAGRVLIGTATDNGTDALQVTGSLVASTQVKTAGLTTGVRTVTAADTATTSDHTIIGNLAAAATETLPAAPLTGQQIYLVNVSAFSWTIAGNGKSIWAGAASAVSLTVYQGSSARLVYDGTLWRAIHANLDGPWITWAPSAATTGTMTITSYTVNDAQYLIAGAAVHFKIYVSITFGGTASNTATFSLPLPIAGGQVSTAAAQIFQTGGAWNPAYCLLDNTGNTARVSPAAGANFGLVACFILIQGTYRLF